MTSVSRQWSVTRAQRLLVINEKAIPEELQVTIPLFENLIVPVLSPHLQQQIEKGQH